jgi:hypothetical protein
VVEKDYDEAWRGASDRGCVLGIYYCWGCVEGEEGYGYAGSVMERLIGV